jgi:type I restriction enzyme M protein
MYRGGAEKKIRQYLVEHNFVDAIIQLPSNLFYGAAIATCIMVLKKNKSNSDILFIEASEEFVKSTNNNKLTPDNIAHIMEAYESRQNIPHFAQLVSLDQIQENDYNLSVSSYVEQKDTREKIDIVQLNAQIRDIVAKEQQLRDEIDRIIAEIEGDAPIPQHQATLNI